MFDLHRIGTDVLDLVDLDGFDVFHLKLLDENGGVAGADLGPYRLLQAPLEWLEHLIPDFQVCAHQPAHSPH